MLVMRENQPGAGCVPRSRDGPFASVASKTSYYTTMSKPHPGIPNPAGYYIPFPDTTEGSSQRNISDEQVAELKEAVKGDVLLISAPNFDEYTKTFNRGLKTPAKLIVRPVDAQDVSATVLFCARHSLSPSIKAGGYGTHCWSVAGDIIIDLSGIKDIDFDMPGPGGDYIGLKDRKRKGKNVLSGERNPPSTTQPQPQTQPQATQSIPPVFKRTRTRDEAFGPDEDTAPALSITLRMLDEAESEVPSATRRRVDEPMPEPLEEGEPEVPQPAPGNLAAFRGPETVHAHGMAPPKTDGLPEIRYEPAFQRPAFIQGSSSGGGGGYNMYGAGPNALPFNYSMPSGMGHVVGSGPAFSFPHAAHAYLGGGVSMSDPPPPAPLVFPLTYEHPYALVTFGAGATQKLIDEHTSTHPLPATGADGTPTLVSYHVPFAAHPVGSAVMMLGGFGFMSRMRGLSMDNLVEVEMVLADGRVVVVNERENTDLWWAVRGAGPAFGVAVRYVAKAWPCPVVFAGNLLYNFNPSTAPSLLKHYRDCVKAAPRELYANCLLTAGPPGRGAIIVIQMCYLGPRALGAAFLEAISAWSGERCLLNEVDEKSFMDQQDSVAKVLRAAGGSGEGGEEGRSWFIRSDLAGTLTDEMIHRTVMGFSETTDGCTWLFELGGGALTDFKDTCLPITQREAAFTVVAFHKWPIVGGDMDCIKQAEEWIHKVIGPNSTGGPLPCFAERCENLSRIIGMFGRDNWVRLVDLKRQYDPAGLFRHCVWPLDTEGSPIMSVDAQGRKTTFVDLPRARPAETGGEQVVDVSG